MRLAEPSPRNFSIYCAIEFEGASLRKVADEHHLSPTRVQQIVAQTRQWYVESTPAWVQAIDSHQQPLIACRVHEARLQHLYSQSMEAWRASQCEVTTTRHAVGLAGLGEVRITKRSFGEPRYLTAAMQMSRAQIDAQERLCEIIDRQQERGLLPVRDPQEPIEFVPANDKEDDARSRAAWNDENAHAEEPATPCAREDAPAAEVVEPETEVVTLSLDAAVGSVATIALPLATSVARGAPQTPVRNRKQQRKWERHQRRVAGRKG